MSRHHKTPAPPPKPPFVTDLLCLAFLLGLCLVIGLPRYRSGIDMGDEGFLAYGGVRVLMAVLTQWRDGIFARVAMHAVRKLAYLTFVHMHELSLRFHLERKTGGLTRVLERGRAGHAPGDSVYEQRYQCVQTQAQHSQRP